MTELEGVIKEILTMLKKWNGMAIERRIPYLRAVKVSLTLCKRLLQETPFEHRSQKIFSLLREMPDHAWPDVKVHWVEYGDGTKWIYFCQADPHPKCDKCLRRVDCLTT